MTGLVIGLGLLFVVLGVLSAAFPRMWWNASRWQYRHPEALEPSDASFAVGRVAGIALAVLGVGVMIGFASLARDDQRRREAEQRRDEASGNPRGVVDRYAAEVLKEARRSGTPPRRLGPTALDAVAARLENLSVEPARGFERSGAVIVAVQNGSLYGDPYCLVLPEALENRSSITEGSCEVSIDDERSAIEVFAKSVMDQAKTRRVSPRDPALLAEFAHRSNAHILANAHSTGFQIALSLNKPFGSTVFWCIELPATIGGTPQLSSGFCSSPRPATTMPGH